MDAVSLEYRLRKGLWQRGRVTDKRSGEPVPRASVQYYAPRENPAAQGLEGFEGALTSPYSVYQTDADGRYAVPVLPGPGLVGVFEETDLRYPRGGGARGIRLEKSNPPHSVNFRFTYFDALPTICNAFSRHGLAAINAPAAADPPALDFRLDPGEVIAARVLDPEGRPLTGARSSTARRELDFVSFRPIAGGADRFEIAQYFPDQPRRVLALHEGKKLAGWVVVEGEPRGPVEVRLRPWGTVRGRLVDAAGRPMAGVALTGPGYGELDLLTPPALPEFQYLTDREGRFRIAGLAPGVEYRLCAPRIGSGTLISATLDAGEEKDLGDVAVRVAPPAPAVID